MAIGDVNSSERGSGARYNDGKVRLDFIPARVLARYYAPVHATRVLYALARFEETHDQTNLVDALASCVGEGGSPWREACAVFEYGAKKYAAWNWAKGMPWSVPMACAKRHLVAIAEGEQDDPESGLPHFGHVACNIVMLLHFVSAYPEGDDLPPLECFGDVEAPCEKGEEDDDDYIAAGNHGTRIDGPGSRGELDTGSYRPIDYAAMREQTNRSIIK